MRRLELDASKGCVVITRFECQTLLRLLFLIALHRRLERDVTRHAKGLVGATAMVDWRNRTLISISLWSDLDALYSMGQVPSHIEAARLPRRLGIATSCGVYAFAGDWRRVMFGAQAQAQSPLQPLAAGRASGRSGA
jgi:hypothetical protein